MLSLANYEHLPVMQKQAMGFSSPRSPLNNRDLQNYDNCHEIVEVEAQAAEELEEEAAFRAEAEAFARKCNVHELAVRSLVQDLVEENEPFKPVSEPDNCKSDEENKGHVNGALQNGRSSRQIEPTFNRKKVHPVREKSEKDEEASNALAPLNSDKVQSKVREFFKRRKSNIGLGSRRIGDSESLVSNENNMSGLENPDLGPFLLKLAKQAIASGDKPKKALDFATRAAKSYEIAANGKPNLDFVMSLHVLAAVHCSLGQYEDAVTVLKRSITVPDVETSGQEHALAAFAGYMQLGDTLALLGRGEEALSAYHSGLEVQVGALGKRDPHVGETCRYLAEAHAQALQFDKAEDLIQHALQILKENNTPASIQEAADRRLLGLICNGKGQHDAALEHLVLASMTLIANGKDLDVAAVDVSIGDTYVALGRYEEAVFSYQKALTVFKASKGENHIAVANVYASLAELYMRTDKHREAKTYCESAIRIYSRLGANKQHHEEVATGLTELAVIYEALDEHERAISFLQKSLSILEAAPGQQSAVAGIEAQIGVLYYIHGNYADARVFFTKAVNKLRACAEKQSSLFGIVLNQLGLACVQLADVQAAAEAFEESTKILEAKCGLHHPDTLSVYSNLSGAYDALGRLDDAIAVLEYTLEAREGMSQGSDVELEDEKSRLSELLKEAGNVKSKRYTGTFH